MKKALILLLIPVFLATTVGVTIASHYCGGNLVEKGFDIKPCCKDVNKGGCCETTSELMKIKDSFVKASTSFPVNDVLAIENIFSVFELKPSFKEISYSKGYWSKAPPLPDEQLYILYHSLII
ncbi:MAG: hypothetical protein K2X86_08205 [Cytophagaceae bacterium]|nr:hypothetical protein [Cytophagaceae bacterium]